MHANEDHRRTTVVDRKVAGVLTGLRLARCERIVQCVREGVADGGRLVLNPTNGSSYTGTIVQGQQVASSRMRFQMTSPAAGRRVQQ